MKKTPTKPDKIDSISDYERIAMYYASTEDGYTKDELIFKVYRASLNAKYKMSMEQITKIVNCTIEKATKKKIIKQKQGKFCLCITAKAAKSTSSNGFDAKEEGTWA